VNPSFLVSQLRASASELPSDVNARDVVLAALAWPTQGWIAPALDWLEAEVALDDEIADELERVAAIEVYSQQLRHRAFRLAKRWRRSSDDSRP
jgi:hypothetical protein